MKLGNIICSKKINKSDLYNYYHHDDIGDVDFSLPTLSIGYIDTKRCLETINPLEKNLDDSGLFKWCYYRTENEKEYLKDYHYFKLLSYDEIINKYKYYPISLSIKINTIKQLYKYMSKYKGDIEIYTTNDMMYVLCNNIVFGFNIEILIYLNVNPNKLYKKIKKHSKRVLKIKDVKQTYLDIASMTNTNYFPMLVD